MSSIDHLHNETEMLTVKQHSDLLSAQYLVQCLDPDHVCHNITTMDVPPRQMKHTLHTRHYPTVQPLLAATKKETLQAVHTEAVPRAINSQQPNRVLHNRPPPISLEEDTLRRPQQGWGQVQYLYLSTYLSVLDVLEYLVYGNVKVLVLDQEVLGT